MNWWNNTTKNQLIKKSSFWLLAILMMALSACEEQGPDIRLQPPLADPDLKDTTYRASSDTVKQSKNILIEDFTAVRCNNCPKAANIIADLQQQYGKNVIALGIHCNKDFSRPYKESKANYRLEKGQAIYEWFGNPPQPAGMIDRYKFSGENEAILAYQKWKSKAPDRLNAETKVNIYMDQLLDKNNRELKVGVEVRFLQEIKNQFYLSLMVTEDDIIDYQLMPNKSEPKADYEHDHVVRKIVTPSKGLSIFNEPKARRVVYKEFSIKLEEDWKVDNLNVVSFVHTNRPENTVYQTQKIAVE